jgi:hypothetical protein
MEIIGISPSFRQGMMESTTARADIYSCNICIDLHGWRKCRKIAWSNRGHHVHVGYAGGRAMHGAIAESTGM